MTDIVARLRQWTPGSLMYGTDPLDAADQIERLRAALAEAVGILRDIRQTLLYAAERGVTLTGPSVERIDALLSGTPEGNL